MVLKVKKLLSLISDNHLAERVLNPLAEITYHFVLAIL